MVQQANQRFLREIFRYRMIAAPSHEICEQRWSPTATEIFLQMLALHRRGVLKAKLALESDARIAAWDIARAKNRRPAASRYWSRLPTVWRELRKPFQKLRRKQRQPANLFGFSSSPLILGRAGNSPIFHRLRVSIRTNADELR